MKEKNKGIRKLLTSICVVLLLAFAFSIGKVSVEAAGDDETITVNECKNQTKEYTTSNAYTKINSKIEGYFAKVTFYFPERGKISLINEGNYTMYTSTNNGDTWETFDFRFPLTVQAKSKLNLLIKGTSNQKGTLTYSFEKTASLDQWASKDSALDITNGYDGTGTKTRA